MKTALPLVAAALCFICLLSDQTDAAPPASAETSGKTFFDQIFDIPRSVINSVNKGLNENGVKCRDGSDPVIVDGKGTCHDNALGISRSALDSVNAFLNG